MTKQEQEYLKAVERFEAEMRTGDLGRITLAEKCLSRATQKYARGK